MNMTATFNSWLQCVTFSAFSTGFAKGSLHWKFSNQTVDDKAAYSVDLLGLVALKRDNLLELFQSNFRVNVH